MPYINIYILTEAPALINEKFKFWENSEALQILQDYMKLAVFLENS